MSAHRPERLARAANDGDVHRADSLFWSVMSTYVYRFVGLETLPDHLTDFDLQQFFRLGTGDVEAIRQRFRSDRRVAGALQLLFLRACGRPMDRFAVLPRNLLRYVAETLHALPLTIASLRSLYARRPTLYEHQQWARVLRPVQNRPIRRDFADPLGGYWKFLPALGLRSDGMGQPNVGIWVKNAFGAHSRPATRCRRPVRSPICSRFCLPSGPDRHPCDHGTAAETAPPSLLLTGVTAQILVWPLELGLLARAMLVSAIQSRGIPATPPAGRSLPARP